MQRARGISLWGKRANSHQEAISLLHLFLPLPQLVQLVQWLDFEPHFTGLEGSLSSRSPPAIGRVGDCLCALARVVRQRILLPALALLRFVWRE